MRSVRIILLFYAILLFGCLPYHACSLAANSADYLCSYGKQRYKDGNIADAIHELNKALIIEPGNPCARKALAKIFKEQAILPEDFIVQRVICLNTPVDFHIINNRNEIFSGNIYEWAFHDGMRFTGPHVTRSFQEPGKYTVKVTTTNPKLSQHISVEDTFTIEVIVPLTVDLGDDIVLCANRMPQKVSFNATVPQDRDKNLVYLWDFGDGLIKKSGSETLHTYQSPGNYLVRVTAQDRLGTGCNSAADTLKVRILEPANLWAGEDKTAFVDEEVTFEAASDVSANDLTPTWDFGDGESAQGKTVTHSYTKAGTYTATARIESDGPCHQLSDTLRVRVRRSPLREVENISAEEAPIEDAMPQEILSQESASPAQPNDEKEKESIAAVEPAQETAPIIQVQPAISQKEKVHCAGRPITFDATDSFDKNSDKLTYHWDFGDGSTMSGPSIVKHAYQDAGIYTVKLTVNDSHGSECSQAIDIAKVMIKTPPKVNMLLNNACCKMTPITFDASSSSGDGALTYMWDFGDGAKAQGKTTTHEYLKSGTYTVTLSVDDGENTDCSISTIRQDLEISESPVAVIRVAPAKP